ncbi:hypothetical protein HDU97_002403 [Phlyctochytrium planicorne]|nr:hypothetical protein HDU97_002403 [Phlyctochytrium planicorne]
MVEKGIVSVDTADKVKEDAPVEDADEFGHSPSLTCVKPGTEEQAAYLSKHSFMEGARLGDDEGRAEAQGQQQRQRQDSD